MPPPYAGLATLELQAHLRQRQVALRAAAQQLVAASRRLGHSPVTSGCVRVCRGIEQLGRLTDDLLRLLGEPPPSHD